MVETTDNDNNKNVPSGVGGITTGPEIKGRFARYTSAFLQIVLPFLSLRYFIEGADLILEPKNKLTHLGRIKPLESPNKGVAKWLVSNTQPLTFGSAISIVIGYYTSKTYKDIKEIYRETLGYELNKKPEEVTFGDMLHSQNRVIKVTNAALVKRTLLRFGSAATFFLPWGLLNRHTYRNSDKLDNVGLKMGTGVMGAYLFLDGFLRKESFFEAMQVLSDTKINHANGNNPHEIIEPREIERMMLIQKKAQDKSFRAPHASSPEAEENIKLSTAIADKMNRTYGNSPNPEGVHFTTGDFIYLFGQGLLDKFPESMAYVELSGKSKAMEEVKAVSVAIKNGMNPEAAFAEYGIALGEQGVQKTVQFQPEEQATARKYTDIVQSAKNRIPVTPRAPQDFVVQETTVTMLGQ